MVAMVYSSIVLIEIVLALAFFIPFHNKYASLSGLWHFSPSFPRKRESIRLFQILDSRLRGNDEETAFY
ncbi:hypothetical protein [Chlorobaculum parvum]|uniref:hypothetical protein n=1 Tax=Chlorobaculum parvum TaxID=274539 RepID=UPI0012EA84B0|nr:hypothetical protein [Chlorobaculum parvum]